MLEQILHIEQDQIDKRATRKRVESLLETVRLHQTLGRVRRDGGMHNVSKVAEMPAEYIVASAPEEQAALLQAEVEQALSRLDEQEEAIIRRRYLQKEKVLDYLLCYEVNMSERTYRRVKARAMEKLAYMLRAEVVRTLG
ncbi:MULTISPECIES: ArpU family phage packaging/lysis transcriptional regulator [Paenibacillus]|uniref:ArpU family phage packaging/lysis transcriptional regulator n=1 Tax=Paenibacillus violae TaxID=3077234 RepID=A0ABU3RJ03_9BACL|nr:MULTISPECIES: ArpU family phage packaging/lysis transcriptional regulator [Paenibacillus]MDU0203817.1 ArpU family phage packaging/lysis transcriptional regulator [Paenibacillus sp. PFR10]MEC0264443.1 ArpU family phage packaging/lysis transcriptional regulator [Paenibacillus anseongense]